jgi:hypothetical protein
MEFFSILGKINETVHWADIAANISHGINTFITGVNWEENGQILSTFVKKSSWSIFTGSAKYRLGRTWKRYWNIPK